MKTYMGDDMPKMPWMIDYTYTSKKESKQLAAYADTYLDYQCNLNIQTKLGRQLLTNIICALGVEKSNPAFIEDLLKEGISCACIDTSGADISDQIKLLSNIEKAVKNFHKYSGRIFPFPIALELVSLRIRTGNLYKQLSEGVILNENDFIYLTCREEYKCHCDKTFIYIDFNIFTFIKRNHLIYINFGQIILAVVEVKRECCKCVIKKGGFFKSQSLVHIPNIPQQYFINKKEDDVIAMAIERNIDIFIVSPVRSSEDIKRIRNLLGENANSNVIFAKIQDMIGVENIEEIINIADGVIISRAELSIDIPLQKLFIIQKSIIARCNRIGKPVICASYFVQSMSKSDSPSRAEMLDVANAVLDGTDGILLTEDVVHGVNPLAALKHLRQICMEAEASVFQKDIFSNIAVTVPSPMPPTYSIAISAVDTAMKSNAVCIIVLTVSGRSAKLISQFRPPCPIIAVTRYGNVSRKLNIWRGIIPMQYVAPPHAQWKRDVDKRFLYAMTFGKFSGLIKGGDAVVLVSSWTEGSGFTNTVRIVYASQNNCIKDKKKKQ